jgi:hypothetical protein
MTDKTTTEATCWGHCGQQHDELDNYCRRCGQPRPAPAEAMTEAERLGKQLTDRYIWGGVHGESRSQSDAAVGAKARELLSVEVEPLTDAELKACMDEAHLPGTNASSIWISVRLAAERQRAKLRPAPKAEPAPAKVATVDRVVFGYDKGSKDGDETACVEIEHRSDGTLFMRREWHGEEALAEIARREAARPEPTAPPPEPATPALEAWQREEGLGPWDDLREAFLSDLSRVTAEKDRECEGLRKQRDAIEEARRNAVANAARLGERAEKAERERDALRAGVSCVACYANHGGQLKHELDEARTSYVKAAGERDDLRAKLAEAELAHTRTKSTLEAGLWEVLDSDEVYPVAETAIRILREQKAELARLKAQPSRAPGRTWLPAVGELSEMISGVWWQSGRGITSRELAAGFLEKLDTWRRVPREG